jgi:hypothetical protein
MLCNMPTRTTLTAVAAAAVLTSTAITTSAHADENDCSVVDLSPHNVVIGLGHSKDVTFDVGTDCDDQNNPINWALTFRVPGQHSGNPLLQNYEGDQPSRYRYIPGGQYTWNREDNGDPGPRTVTVDAFIGDPTDSHHFSGVVGFNLLRRTTFGSSFNASPEPRRRGQKITIDASLSFANWHTNRYKKFGAWVKLQFRPAGQDAYQDVKWVWDNGIGAKTTVRATRTGTWRYHFPGDATHAASNSKGDTVAVRR